jgi:hypothetical protein
MAGGSTRGGWDPKSGKEPFTRNSAGPVYSLMLSHDGKRLYSAGEADVKVWGSRSTIHRARRGLSLLTTVYGSQMIGFATRGGARGAA